MSNNGRTKHKQVKIKLREDLKVEVDEKMAKLIQAFWKAGMMTRYSCQGEALFIDQTHWENNPYRAYVMLEKGPVAMSFVADLLANFDIFRKGEVLWSIDFNRGPHDDLNRIVLRFPQQDIKALRKFIERWDNTWL